MGLISSYVPRSPQAERRCNGCGGSFVAVVLFDTGFMQDTEPARATHHGLPT